MVKHLVGNEEIMGSIPIDGSILFAVDRPLVPLLDDLRSALESVLQARLVDIERRRQHGAS